MSEDKLRKELDELQNRLDKTDPKDEAGRERIQSLRDGIQSVKEQDGPVSTETRQDLLHRMESALEHFEVSHPTLTGVVNNVIRTLNNIGI